MFVFSELRSADYRRDGNDYPSSTGRRAAPGLALIVSVIVLAGCVSANEIAKQIGRPPEEAAKLRAMETRRFDSIDEEKLILASTQTMQDLGFIVSESSREGGVVTGSKDRDATETGQVALQVGLTIAFALAGVAYQPVWDTAQTIHATIVAYPVGSSRQTDIRVTFDRIVVDTNGHRRAELINEPSIYQGFFNRFSESVLLEAHPI